MFIQPCAYTGSWHCLRQCPPAWQTPRQQSRQVFLHNGRVRYSSSHQPQMMMMNSCTHNALLSQQHLPRTPQGVTLPAQWVLNPPGHTRAKRYTHTRSLSTTSSNTCTLCLAATVTVVVRCCSTRRLHPCQHTTNTRTTGAAPALLVLVFLMHDALHNTQCHHQSAASINPLPHMYPSTCGELPATCSHRQAGA